MPSTLYTPLNGNEIKEVMTKQFERWRDSLYLLKAYSAFHKAIFKTTFEMSAFPADVPVPKGELTLEFLPKRFELIKSRFQGHATSIEELEQLQIEIAEVLEMVNPFAKREIIEDAGDTPDNIRKKYGMPVLIRDDSDGRVKEVSTTNY